MIKINVPKRSSLLSMCCGFTHDSNTQGWIGGLYQLIAILFQTLRLRLIYPLKRCLPIPQKYIE